MAAEVACHDEYGGLEDLHGGALEGVRACPAGREKGFLYRPGVEIKSKARCRDSTCVAESTGANHYMQGILAKVRGITE